MTKPKLKTIKEAAEAIGYLAEQVSKTESSIESLKKRIGTMNGLNKENFPFPYSKDEIKLIKEKIRSEGVILKRLNESLSKCLNEFKSKI